MKAARGLIYAWEKRIRKIKKIHIIQSDQLHETRIGLGGDMREIYFRGFWIRKWVGNSTHK